MLTLSPWKILVIVVVALLVLGPEKLPSVARQIGGFWGDLRRLRTRLETEVRGVFPDLPPSHEVARAVRSPIAYLNRLADEHEQQAGQNGSGDASAGAGAGTGAPAEGGQGSPSRPAVADGPPRPAGAWPPEGGAGPVPRRVPDDPSMN